MESREKLRDGMSIFQIFVALHKSQLESSGVPGQFWEILSKKLHNQIFDAGDTFSLLRIEYESEREIHAPLWKVVVSCDKGVRKSDPGHIYLIDHAWTYGVNAAREHLRDIPGLLDRMASLMGVVKNADTFILEELVETVFNQMWRFNQTYAIGSVARVEDRMPVWYIMDEFGSAIQHSDTPNFRAVPLIYLPDQVTYTIIFPIEDVVEGEEVTRNFVEGPVHDFPTREALLLPWKPTSFTQVDFKQDEPDANYFLEGHVLETLPNLDKCKIYPVVPEVKLKVFTEYIYISTYLTHTHFEITNDENSADILWYTKHFKTFRELSEIGSRKFINQFPFENVLTVKDLLCIVCRRKAESGKSYNPETLETYPLWLPTTYNLKTELPKFVSYYQHREENGLDNYWICKPWNLARGLDTHITNNINYIVKLPFTGPKIAQKYIEDPVLFYRPEIGNVKFDVRYVILLKSVEPLEAYAYKNFFLRFANKPFELKNFDNYETHFTVMNYNDSTPLCRKLTHEFIEEFEQQQNIDWDIVEVNIFSMLHEMLEAAVSKDPPCSFAKSPQSRALYAVDLMLAWRVDENGSRVIQPKLLEVNWTPDCQRACEYYPDFYNDIFSLLFLNEMKEESFKAL